jgi:hypothetical protein
MRVLSGKAATGREEDRPTSGWHELARFGMKLGLPAGLAGMLAIGGERPLVLWLALFQAFATATAALCIAAAIASGAPASPSARPWREALGFTLAALSAHFALAALR